MAENKPGFDPEVQKEPKDISEGGDDLPPKKIESEKVEDGKDDDLEIEEKDIPVRRSAVQQHIISRQKETIEKLRNKSQEEIDELKPIEDDDDLSPEARNAVGREIKRAVSPLLNQLASKADEDELQFLFANESDSKGYEKRIRSYMKSDSWKGVPPEAIYHHLAFEQAANVGSKQKNAADIAANLNRGGGRTLRPALGEETNGLPTAEEMENMTDEEIEKVQDDVRMGKYNQ